ncbi:MFS transporter [Patescibacteria group bacterium]|nr:MFS transporter [Patescibacteria group bacterium]MBU1890393.1 MFS transporter [Patescibacteria group bacterium]
MKKALKLLLLFDTMVMFSTAMLTPIYAVFVEEIGGDILSASQSWAIFTLVAGVVIFLMGKMEDKVKEQELAISLGYFIIGVGYLGYLMVSSVLSLFIVQIIIGLGFAISSPAFSASFTRHLETGKYASQWGSWESTDYIVTALGALAGGVVATIYGFTSLFVIMAIFCFVSAIIIYLLPRDLI